MMLLILFFVLYAGFTESLELGAACSFDDNSPGTCTSLKDCQPVFEALITGNPPDKICGYDPQHADPIICCPKNTTTTTTTRVTRSAVNLDAGSKRGAIARQKCAEYAESVFTTKYLPALAGDQRSINVSQCAIKSSKLILDITRADRMEFPHMAAVGFDMSTGGIGWFCGGSLISETFVLTSAVCTHISSFGDAKWVRVGDLDLVSSDDGAKPEERRIIERITHPEYKPPSQYHDIALLRLESRVPFNGWIRPACLHTAPTTGIQKAIATGWGSREWSDEEGSSHLKKMTMPLIDWQTCNKSWTFDAMDIHLPKGIVDDWSICAGNEMAYTCQGDIGGPLVIYSKPEYHCMYDVVGIASLGKLCGTSTPDIFTRVYHYIPWIESVVWGEE